MTAPRWAAALLRRLAAPPEAEILVGDLEEAHRARVARRGHCLRVGPDHRSKRLDIAFMLDAAAAPPAAGRRCRGST